MAPREALVVAYYTFVTWRSSSVIYSSSPTFFLDMKAAWLRPVRNSSLTIFFFFQAEDGIRDLTVTGVQTCALPICAEACKEEAVRGSPTHSSRAGFCTELCSENVRGLFFRSFAVEPVRRSATAEIGRASCRERV